MKRESLVTIREGDGRFISLRVLLACGVPLSAGTADRGGRRTEKNTGDALWHWGFHGSHLPVSWCLGAVTGGSWTRAIAQVGGAGGLCEWAGGKSKRQDLAKLKRWLKETLVYECFWKWSPPFLWSRREDEEGEEEQWGCWGVGWRRVVAAGLPGHKLLPGCRYALWAIFPVHWARSGENSCSVACKQHIAIFFIIIFS